MRWERPSPTTTPISTRATSNSPRATLKVEDLGFGVWDLGSCGVQFKIEVEAFGP